MTKIVTAWLALQLSGSDYRFQTRFYLDDDRVLYVRGGGDHFLKRGNNGANRFQVLRTIESAL